MLDEHEGEKKNSDMGKEYENTWNELIFDLSLKWKESDSGGEEEKHFPLGWGNSIREDTRSGKNMILVGRIAS